MKEIAPKNVLLFKKKSVELTFCLTILF